MPSASGAGAAAESVEIPDRRASSHCYYRTLLAPWSGVAEQEWARTDRGPCTWPGSRSFGVSLRGMIDALRLSLPYLQIPNAQRRQR